jgi:hypothetical protein
MEFDHLAFKANDLLKKPPPSKAAEPAHPLQELPQVLGNHAFAAVVSEAVTRFRLWYFNRTNAPVPDAVWEAFTNCFAACSGAKAWGPTVMELAGRTNEFRRHYLGEGAQAHAPQDAHNQALGRSFAMRQFECDEACRAAAIASGLLDLTAPVRRYWTPSDGIYAAPASRAGSRLPAAAPSAHKRQD